MKHLTAAPILNPASLSASPTVGGMVVTISGANIEYVQNSFCQIGNLTIVPGVVLGNANAFTCQVCIKCIHDA